MLMLDCWGGEESDGDADISHNTQNTIRELRNIKTDLTLPLLKTSSCQKCKY